MTRQIEDLGLKTEIYGPYWVSHVLSKVNGQDDERPDWMTEEE
jgi:hypothetical protein